MKHEVMTAGARLWTARVVGGTLAASPTSPEIETSLMQHRGEIAARGGHAAVPVKSDQELLELNTGTRVSLTPLVAPPGRPVGWLVQESRG